MGRISKDRIERFKKDEFAIQLMMAMGDQKVSTFCRSVGLSTTDLHLYMNQMKTTPPSYNTLVKIARVSADHGVTLESLAMDAGFTKKTLQEYEKRTHATLEEPVKEKPAIKITPEKGNPIPEKPARIPKTSIAVKEPMMLSAFISVADTYDDYNPPEFFIFEGREQFKAFGKLVRLHGVSKAQEYVTDKERPLFVLRADVILKFLSDRPIICFCALNGNKFAIVL